MALSPLDIQQNATNQAFALNKNWYDQSKRAVDPYINAGTNALLGFQQAASRQPDMQYVNRLASMNPNISMNYSQVMNDPFTQELKRQAMEQNARRASAMGLSNSSIRGEWDANSAMQAGLAARDRIYGQNVDNYNRQYGQLTDLNNMTNAANDNYFNRMSSLAGMGQNAAVNMANIGSNYANAQGNLLTGMANAQAGNILASDAASQQASADQRNALLGLAGSVVPSYLGYISNNPTSALNPMTWF